MTPPSEETLLEMVHEALRKAEIAEEGHKRLRAAIVGFGERLEDLEHCQSSMRVDITTLKAPQDLTRGVIPTRLVVAAVFSVITICGMIIGAAASVKSDVRDNATKYDAHIKLEDERENARQRFNEDMKKAIELNRIQVESIRQELARQQRR